MDKMTDSRAVEVLAAMRDEGSCVDDADWTAAIDRAIAALSQQPEARVYQCPRCATSMEVDPTAKPEAQGGGESAAEIAKLVEFFRGEGYQAFGWDGDVSNLSPADTAIKAMRAAMQKRSPSMRINPHDVQVVATPPSAPVGDRPLRDVAEIVIGAYLLRKLGAEPAFEMTEDGDDGWAFWIADGDTTSYLHADLRVEWLGTSWEPSAPVGVEAIIAEDDAGWALAKRAEAAGAERDESDDDLWWTLRIEQFKALAQQPAAKSVAWVAEVFPDWTTLRIAATGEAFAFNRETGRVYKIPHPDCPFVTFPASPTDQQPAAVDGVKGYPLWQAIHAESAKAGHPCNVGLAQVIAALDALATQPGGPDNE